MSNNVQFQGAPGFRFYKDLFVESRGMGLSYYPYCAINSGLVASTAAFAANAPAAATSNFTVAITAGSAYLDATLASSPAVNVTVNPSRDSLPQFGLNAYNIFVSPTRQIQPRVRGAAVPTTLLNGAAVSAGDGYVLVSDLGEYLEADGFFEYNGLAWLPTDPTFKGFSEQNGRLRSYGGECKPTLAASNFTVNSIEKEIFLSTQYGPFVSRNSQAQFRDSASLNIASLNLYYFVLPFQVTATFTNGSTTAVLDAASAAQAASLFSSVTNTNTLRLDGAALAAAGYTNGVITLAAAYAGTTGTKPVLITPVTPGNNYVLSTSLSALVSSTNLVRQ